MRFGKKTLHPLANIFNAMQLQLYVLQMGIHVQCDNYNKNALMVSSFTNLIAKQEASIRS